jgi:hypothetical protein
VHTASTAQSYAIYLKKLASYVERGGDFSLIVKEDLTDNLISKFIVHIRGSAGTEIPFLFPFPFRRDRKWNCFRFHFRLGNGNGTTLISISVGKFQ